MRAGLFVVALGLAGCRPVDVQPSLVAPVTTDPEATAIRWQPWSPESFARAAEAGKMSLVDVGMEGCTACRWMDEDTYTNAEVIARVEAHFVPISVDSEARPDVGERYVEWGWPATIFMNPDGTFFTSQEDDAPQLPKGLSAADYYRTLDDAGRRTYGVPPIDHAVYTDRNALAVRAYAEFFGATGDAGFGARAQRAGDAMLARQDGRGVFAQFTATALAEGDNRMRSIPQGDRVYLRPQALMGLALLSLAEATGEARYDEAAVALAQGMLGTLEDPDGGGFFATDDASMDHVAPRRKPLEENAAAAHFLYLIGVRTANPALREAAHKTMRAVATPAAIKAQGLSLGRTAVAFELLRTGAVEMSVVGRAVDQAHALALYDAGRVLYEPRKALHFQAPGRSPKQHKAAMFICNDTACSSPIRDPAAVPTEAARFAARQ